MASQVPAPAHAVVKPDDDAHITLKVDGPLGAGLRDGPDGIVTSSIDAGAAAAVANPRPRLSEMVNSVAC